MIVWTINVSMEPVWILWMDTYVTAL